MNKFTTLMTLAATTAAGVALADLTPFDKLELTPAASFAKTDKTTVEGDLSSATAALVVGPGDATALKDVEKFTIVFNVGFVEWAELQKVKPAEAKIGFAFTNATHAAYFNGTVWTPVDLSALTTPISVAEEDEKTLLIELDRRDTTKKARFSFVETVEGVETKTVVKDWVAVADVVSNTVAIYGSGTILSVNGATYTIAAEVIEIIPEGEKSAIDIKLTPKQAAAIGDPKVTLENGHTALTSYILFGKAHGDVTAADTPQVVGVPKASAADKVALKVQGLNVQDVEGVTVQYKLMGSETGAADSWTQVVAPQDSTAFEFDASTNYRFFKVVTVITYATATK